MKKIIIGVGVFLSGIVILCMDYATNRIIESMPTVSLVPGGIPLSAIALLLMIVGIIFVLYGYFCEKEE